MRRIVPGLLVAILLAATGCNANPLLGRWQSTDCSETVTFTATQAIHGDRAGRPGDDVTYDIQGTAVYVMGSAMQMGAKAVPYNVIDHDHLLYESTSGYSCSYVRVK